MKRIFPAMALLGLAACVDDAGPVLGDWRGTEPARAIGFADRVELILDGAAGATSGTYHLVVDRPSTQLGVDEGRLDWSDHWSSHPVRSGGATYTLIHLANVPGARNDDYALMADGTLVPVIDPGHPDFSANALRLALRPLPRTAFGYGRA